MPHPSRAFQRAACFGATRPLARLRLGLRPRLHFETLHVSAAHVLPRPNGLFRRPVDRSAYTSTPSGRGPAEIGSSERSPPGEGPETRRACTPNEFAADPPRRLVRPRSPRAFSRRLPPVRGAIRCRRVRLLVSHRAPPGRSTNRTSAAPSARLRRLSPVANAGVSAFGLLPVRTTEKASPYSSFQFPTLHPPTSERLVRLGTEAEMSS
jgi:hypothetical protein